MEYDANLKRIMFIDKSINIREAFDFADPTNMLQAVQLYAGDAYGAMLWDLYGVKAKQYFNTWNTCTKLCWEVPRVTHTYFVESILASQFKSFSTSIKSRYIRFFDGLRKSNSTEVQLLAELVGRDASSTTGKNLVMLERETGLNPWSTTPGQVKDALAAIVKPVPQQDEWRLGCLQKLLVQRYNLKRQALDTEDISTLIDSLCIN